MVLLHCNSDKFYNDFGCVTSVIFNKYPIPYATHILSKDVIRRTVSADGTKLYSTRLIRKKGKLPSWIEYLVGDKITESWMVEYSTVDRENQVMRTFIKNLDHVKFLRVEESTVYRYNRDGRYTEVKSEVKFISSGFRYGVKDKIESMARAKFEESVARSRRGMSLVLQTIEDAKSTAIPETQM